MLSRERVRYGTVLFDFDGVLVESNRLRTEGFRQVLAAYPAEQVETFIAFHQANGGLSRYSKFRYFFQTIRREPEDEARIKTFAESFSQAVKQRIVDAPWVSGALEFMTSESGHRRLFVVSGSDQGELRAIMTARGAAGYFVECVGSPVEKTENVRMLIQRHGLAPSDTVLVGDSPNDMEAAVANGVAFIARRSGEYDWTDVSVPVIATLHDLRRLV